MGLENMWGPVIQDLRSHGKETGFYFRCHDKKWNILSRRVTYLIFILEKELWLLQE